MDRNVIFFAWNRAVPGREKISGQHFEEFVAYLGGKAQNGAIESFDVVFLDPHGGDMNGFFLIRGNSGSLDALTATAEWTEHMTRAALHLQGAGAIRGATADQAMKRMELWNKHIPG
jgi:hypothetical protein